EHICELYNHDQNDSLIAQAPRDMAFHKSIGQWEHYYETWMHLVNTYTFMGKVNTALREVKQMHDDATQRNDNYGLALSNYAMGNAYNNMGYLPEAVKCYQLSIQFIRQTNTSETTYNDIYESYLSKGNIHSIVYSNPNNPSWVCFTDNELRIIADVAKKYDVVVVEDLAYFGMDFRQDISTPGMPPYQPTVAKYVDKYILMISSSKAFSYAGERLSVMVISDALFTAKFPDLQPYFNTQSFGHAMIYGTIYALTSGTSHSAQYAMAAILKACNDGDYNLVQGMIDYRDKAHEMKRIFTENGFTIVYDKDEDKPLSDGFYFTIGYPGFTGDKLLEELLYYGVSAISLSTCNSNREGLRACVSLVNKNQFPDLEKRLQAFHKNHQ
ncbi:MAG: pyridoxal phosphate-dependent aminotransferase, partial [Bacteroidales bacterium]|nr:pyridoxal phosphate-dependent aminotransferase [Bacteroidales bacterium]